MQVLVAQLSLTLCHPMDCSLPGSSVHEILQERILEWVAISYSRGIFLTQGLPALQADSSLSGHQRGLYTLQMQKFKLRGVERVF